MKKDSSKLIKSKPATLILAYAIACVVAVIYSAPYLIERFETNSSIPSGVNQIILIPFAERLSRISAVTGLDDLRVKMDRTVQTLKNLEPVGGSNSIVYKHVYKDGYKQYKKDALSQKAQKRVLIIGASSIQLQLGALLERRLQKFNNVKVYRKGKISSGLNWPERLNWIKKTKELVKKFKPNILIMQFGGNDCVRSRNPYGPKKYERFGTPLWNKIYIEKVKTLIDIFRESGGQQAVILGMPIMGVSKFSKKIQYLNNILQEAAEKTSAIYIPTWGITSDKNGKYQQYFTINGKSRKIREKDQIHLTKTGALYVSKYIINQLKEPLDLRKK